MPREPHTPRESPTHPERAPHAPRAPHATTRTRLSQINTKTSEPEGLPFAGRTAQEVVSAVFRAMRPCGQGWGSPHLWVEQAGGLQGPSRVTSNQSFRRGPQAQGCEKQSFRGRGPWRSQKQGGRHLRPPWSGLAGKVYGLKPAGPGLPLLQQRRRSSLLRPCLHGSPAGWTFCLTRLLFNFCSFSGLCKNPLLFQEAFLDTSPSTLSSHSPLGSQPS